MSDASDSQANRKSSLFFPDSDASEGLNSSDLARIERKKRKREVLIVFFLAGLFLFLSWFEVKLFSTAQQLPFEHSIFFFGLVNFNIVLLLLLLFLIFRNIVKIYLERRNKLFGSSLKVKLVVSFVTFSFVPTLLIFLISVFYINSSFDKWFSLKMIGVLRSSLEVTDTYYKNSKKKNYHFAHQIAQEIKRLPQAQVSKKLKTLQAIYSLDAIEFYPSLFGARILAVANDDNIPAIPKVSIEFLQKGIGAQVESSTIHQFGDGNLVRVIVPVKEGEDSGAVVVSSFVPLSLISKMNDISQAYKEFSDLNTLEYPLKSIYLIILFLMTLMILLAATWFGFYLAKQLSTSLVQLGRATKRIAGGDYSPLLIESGSEEITHLVDSFNQMTVYLSKSEREVREANENLKQTLQDLDQHTRYIEIILESVSAGVISVDKSGHITTINRHAGHLLKLDPALFVGRPVRELLTLEYFRTFFQLLKTMNDHQIQSIQKELKVNVQGESLPLQMKLSILRNEKGEEIGQIVVFDDMSALVSAQRSAAWTEVARRIAHEIKNPLTPIKLSAERLQRKFGAQILDPAFLDCTRMIIQQTEDLKNLVNEFSQFARLPQAKLQVGSINQVIQEAAQIFISAHPEINFVTELDPDLPEFKFDPDQIRRVLTNLIDNSVAASENQENPRVDLCTRFDPRTHILRLSVSDLGSGIPQEQRNRVFEPYYTTKTSGTGLGLAIVKRIIEDHGGFIRALGNEPAGTKMLIELPVNEVDAWNPADRTGKL